MYMIAVKIPWRYGYEYYEKGTDRRLCCCDFDLGDQQETEAELVKDGYTIER